MILVTKAHECSFLLLWESAKYKDDREWVKREHDKPTTQHYYCG